MIMKGLGGGRMKTKTARQIIQSFRAIYECAGALIAARKFRVLNREVEKWFSFCEIACSTSILKKLQATEKYVNGGLVKQ